MRKILLVLLLLCAAHLAHAQQEPKWNHYMFNDFFYNPAVAGSRDAISAFLIHRYQWVNIPGDASPRTTSGSIHMPVKFLHGGLGLIVAKDDEFFNSTTSFRLAYSYRASVGNGSLGIGLYGGGFQSTLDGTKFDPTDLNDPLLVTGIVNAFAFDVGFGAHYTSEDMYINLSSNRLNNPVVRYNNTGAELTVDRNFFLSGGYHIPVGASFKITPSAFLKTNLSAFQVDFNVLATFRDNFWFGGGYSTGDAAIFMVGANVGKNIRFGYAYDYNLGALGNLTTGSHELFLSWDFNIVFPEKPQVIIRSPRFL